MSRCAVESGVPLFIAAKAEPKRNILYRSPTSSAKFIRARPDNPYKRYVTNYNMCNDASINLAIDNMLQLQQQNTTRLTQNLNALDTNANREMPKVLNKLRGYTVRGVVRADVNRLIQSLQQLDPQGRTAMHLWFTDPIKKGQKRMPRSDNLLSRTKKTNMAPSAIETVKGQVAKAQLLVDAAPVQIEPAATSALCNLRIQKGAGNDLFNYLTQEPISLFDKFVRVTTDDGASACTPSIGVYDMAVNEDRSTIDPISMIEHWSNLSNTPIANVAKLPVHVKNVYTEIDIPVVRAYRVAKAMM